MVYTPKLPTAPDPGQFKEFKDWVRAITDTVYGGQSLLARAGEVKPQAVSGWLAGSVPKDRTLKKLATNLPCNYSGLLLLARGANTSTSNSDNNAIRTAELLRHWKQLIDDDVQQLAIDYLKSLSAVATKRESPAARKKRGA